MEAAAKRLIIGAGKEKPDTKCVHRRRARLVRNREEIKGARLVAHSELHCKARVWFGLRAHH